MKTISNIELAQHFEKTYPCDLINLADRPKEYFHGNVEAIIETEKYKGIPWDNVTIEMLQACYDIPLLFNPAAFHYFFPSFIKLSQSEIEKSDMLVDVLINLLADSSLNWPEQLKEFEVSILKENPQIKEALDLIDETKISCWSNERWKLFTRQQWTLILKWLNWIDGDERWDVDRVALIIAINNAKKWQLVSAESYT